MTDEQRFYEPWAPAVGQRVRVRLSGECQAPVQPDTNFYRVITKGHHELIDGVTGEVCVHPDLNGSGDLYAEHGHFYDVRFDHGIKIPGTPFVMVGDTFAAIELEPAEPLPSAEGGA